MRIRTVIASTAVVGLTVFGVTGVATAATHTSKTFDCASIAQREDDTLLGQVVTIRRELASGNADEQSSAEVSLQSLQQHLEDSTVVEAIDQCLASEAAGHNP